MKIIVTTLFISFFLLSHSQDYKSIDKKVKDFPKFNQIDQLVRHVNNNFNTDTEKVRAFYTWTTHNITYDLTRYYEVRAPELKLNFDSEAMNRSIDNQKRKKLAKQIFKYRKALCSGFSALITELCLKSNIEAKTIEGITKTSISYVGNLNYTKNHAWNAVKIDNQWKLIDATFSSGYEDRITGEWINRFNDFYFFTNPKNLLLSHLPAQPKFQLISKPIGPKAFFSRPIFYSKYFASGLQISNSQKGILSVSNKDKRIHITFKNKKRNGSVYYKFNNEITLRKLTLRQNSTGQYEAIIKCKSSKSKALSFYYDNEKILDFKII